MRLRAIYFRNKRLLAKIGDVQSHDFKSYVYTVNGGVITLYRAPYLNNNGVITII